jgi:hypothetical protein
MPNPSAKPISEILFERFCAEVGLECHRVPESPQEGVRTPDYLIKVRAAEIFAEIKHLDPSDEEKKIRELEEKGIAGRVTTPGKRVGREIADSMRQLRTRAKGRSPAICVIYNNVEFGPRLIDPYDVMIGMYGQEVVELQVPPTGSGRPAAITGYRFGGKRKVTPGQNTTLSAVAALNDLTPQLTLWVYHNVHAAIPLEPALLAHPRIHHFALADQKSGGRPEWLEITPP